MYLWTTQDVAHVILLIPELLFVVHYLQNNNNNNNVSTDILAKFQETNIAHVSNFLILCLVINRLKFQ